MACVVDGILVLVRILDLVDDDDLVPFSFGLMICRAGRADDDGGVGDGGVGYFDFCQRYRHGRCFSSSFFPAIGGGGDRGCVLFGWIVVCARRKLSCCCRMGVGNRRVVGVGVGIGTESGTTEEMGVKNAFGCFLFCCG